MYVHYIHRIHYTTLHYSTYLLPTIIIALPRVQSPNDVTHTFFFLYREGLQVKYRTVPYRAVCLQTSTPDENLRTEPLLRCLCA